MSSPLWEFKASIPFSAADTTDDFLLELGDARWSVLLDIISKQAWLQGFFETETLAQAAWSEISTRVETISEPVIRGLPDQEWRDSYKFHFKAWQFGRLYWVPVWEREKFTLPSGCEVLWLDPGLAFGTGNHETTRLCVERLVEYAEKSGVQSSALGVDKTNSELRALGSKLLIIDAGCGSGILALSAVKLGFGQVIGFDNDPEAVRVSEENAALNGLAGCGKFFTSGLEAGLAGRQADLLMANIQADVLLAHAAQLIGAVAPKGMLVLSGILAHERDSVRAGFVALAPDWAIDSRTMGEWADIQLIRLR